MATVSALSIDFQDANSLLGWYGMVQQAAPLPRTSRLRGQILNTGHCLWRVLPEFRMLVCVGAWLDYAKYISVKACCMLSWWPGVPSGMNSHVLKTGTLICLGGGPSWEHILDKNQGITHNQTWTEVNFTMIRYVEENWETQRKPARIKNRAMDQAPKWREGLILSKVYLSSQLIRMAVNNCRCVLYHGYGE